MHLNWIALYTITFIYRYIILYYRFQGENKSFKSFMIEKEKWKITGGILSYFLQFKGIGSSIKDFISYLL